VPAPIALFLPQLILTIPPAVLQSMLPRPPPPPRGQPRPVSRRVTLPLRELVFLLFFFLFPLSIFSLRFIPCPRSSNILLPSEATGSPCPLYPLKTPFYVLLHGDIFSLWFPALPRCTSLLPPLRPSLRFSLRPLFVLFACLYFSPPSVSLKYRL